MRLRGSASVTIYSTLDEALEMLRPYGVELHNGNSNHAPMAAEAMCVLGRSDAVIEWVDRYRRSLEYARAPRGLIQESEWREALGHRDRIADWQAFFENEMAEHSWSEVLNRWIARLAPGLSAAATHGAIRTAHAVRSLAAQNNDVRLRELAAGLGYWAAEYQTLPGAPNFARRLTSSFVSPARALEMIELLPVGRRRVLRSLTGALSELDTFDPFQGVISMIEVPRNPATILSDLTSAFAGICVATASTRFLTIAFVHCVTALYAVRNLAPHLSIETSRSAVRYGWQASAALYTVLGTRSYSSEVRHACKFLQAGLNDEFNFSPGDRYDLIDRAIRSGDEHAIKFIEACLAEFGRRPSPIYLRAADHTITLLTPRI
jgi:hypothetical protein